MQSIFLFVLLVLQYSECEGDITLDALEYDIEEGFEDETLDVMDGHFGDDDEDETLDATELQDNSTSATIYAEEPETFSSNHTCPKIICSLHKLLQLVGQVCQVDGCGARREVDYRITGCCITVFGICTSGHQFNWTHLIL